MNQDYVRIHPYGDRKPRIITPEILKDFKKWSLRGHERSAF
ncbi:hypothetical protein [Lactobacillus amylovorus]|nr:hypothetical protein [Lactobacillus amylovorus]